VQLLKLFLLAAQRSDRPENSCRTLTASAVALSSLRTALSIATSPARAMACWCCAGVMSDRRVLLDCVHLAGQSLETLRDLPQRRGVIRRPIRGRGLRQRLHRPAAELLPRRADPNACSAPPCPNSSVSGMWPPFRMSTGTGAPVMAV